LSHPFFPSSGELLLKVVIVVSYVDTRTTVTAVQTKLYSLHTEIQEHDSDIQHFNNQQT